MLLYYISRGEIQEVQKLLEEESVSMDGSDQDEMELTPVLVAANARNLPMTVLLLKVGVYTAPRQHPFPPMV